MKSMRNPLLIVVAIIIVGFVVVLGGTLIWIQSSHGLRWLQTRINAAIPGSVAIDGCELSILRLHLELHGVTLYDPQGTSIAGVDRFSLTLHWWPLLARRIHLHEVSLQAPWADLVFDPASGINLTRAVVEAGSKSAPPPPAEDGGELPVNVVCRSFRLTDGRLSFKPSDDSMQVHVDGISLFTAGNLAARQAELDLGVSRVRYQAEGIDPPPAHIALKARLDGERLQLSTATIDAGSTTANLKGSVDTFTTTPVVDAMLSIQSQLVELKNIVDIGGDTNGRVAATLSLTGALANPQVRLGLTIDEGRIAGQPLDHFRLAVDLDDRQATIHDSVLKLADGTIRISGKTDLRAAFPSGFLDRAANLDAIAFNLAVVPDIPDLNPWLEPWTTISGKLHGRVRVDGHGVTPSTIFTRLTAEIQGQTLLAPGLDRPLDADLRLAAQMDHGKISIERIDAAIDSLRLTGTASVGLNDRDLAANLVLDAPNLSRALTVAGIPSASGSCHATLHADGRLEQPQLSLSLSARDLGLEPYTLGDITVDANLSPDGILNLSTLTIQNGNATIQGNGRLRLQLAAGRIDPDFDTVAAFDISALSAIDFMASPPVDGRLDGRLTVNGPFKSLQGELSLHATSLITKAASIGDMDARLRWDDGTLQLDRLNLSNGSSTLTAQGHLQLLAAGSLEPVQDPPFVFEAVSDQFDPGDFMDGTKGDFRLQADLTGSIHNPQGILAIDGEKIDLAGQTVESLALDSRVDHHRFWIDRFALVVAPQEEITAKGWVGMDQTLAMDVRSDGIAITHINLLKERFSGDGTLRLAASAQGSMQAPDIDGNLSISDITINGEAMDDMRLAFSLQDMQLHAQGDLNAAMNAAYDLRQGDFNVDLIFDETETATYFKAAGMPNLHGKLSGRINAVGNSRDAINASARVDLDALHLLSGNISLVKADQIRMQLADRKLSIPAFEVDVLSTGNVQLKGEAHVDGLLNVDLNGRLPLAALGAFSPELSDAAGIVAVDGHVSGTADAPRIDARIDLERVAMLVPGLTQKLHDLNGHVRVTEDTIRVQGLNGFLDTGSFSLDGEINHERFTPRDVNLAIQAKALPLDVPDTLSVMLNSDITIAGKDGIADAKGEVVILEGIYYRDVKINWLKLATERQRAVSPESPAPSIPYFDTVNLDIAIGHRQPFEVENNMAELEISPDLKIGGTLARPIVSGRAQVKEGTVTFQKKTFDVTKGVIDFVNPYKTEPEVDIVSQAKIRSWTITLTVKGPPDNLDLELSSVPSETDADVLSLILFGRTSSELNNGKGGSKLSTGQMMAELIAETFGDDIKKNTGLDILQVEESDSSDDEEAVGVTVTVGKHLSDRMTVKYAVESKDGEIIQRAISEYKLLENIMVSGFQDSNGVYGSELVFRIEFR